MDFKYHLEHRTKRAFTLIEMMVFIFIFSIAALTFYRIFAGGTQAMGNVKNRLSALSVANEKMEIIKNLSYPDIATVGGIPAGQIPQDETVVQNNKTFFVHTSVLYVDDPFDGTLAQGTDSNPEDYKQVKVVVYWEQNNPSKSVQLVSTISPPGIESIYTGGILSLHVVDNSGNGVPGAQLNIINNAISPAVNATYTTDSGGNLFLPEAQPANQTYQIQVSKNGYFPVQTYAPYPTSTVYPVDVHGSVVGGTINQKTIVTDKISTINMHTTTPLGATVPSIDFALTGGRKIADTAGSNPQPEYAFNNQSLNTDSNGTKSFSSMSSGPYFFTFKSTVNNSDYVFLKMSSATTAANAFSVDPGITSDITAYLADKRIDSLLVTVADAADGTPIANSSVELKDLNSTYDVTLMTDSFGQAYFPDQSAPLVGGTQYELSVSASGYASSSPQSVTVNKYTTQAVSLTAN
ncbi:MAG TPA: carboxypeptidase regulatory-like domain-containing protein [Patescibacteria group bacterium]